MNTDERRRIENMYMKINAYLNDMKLAYTIEQNTDVARVMKRNIDTLTTIKNDYYNLLIKPSFNEKEED